MAPLRNELMPSSKDERLDSFAADAAESSILPEMPDGSTSNIKVTARDYNNRIDAIRTSGYAADPQQPLSAERHLPKVSIETRTHERKRTERQADLAAPEARAPQVVVSQGTKATEQREPQPAASRVQKLSFAHAHDEHSVGTHLLNTTAAPITQIRTSEITHAPIAHETKAVLERPAQSEQGRSLQPLTESFKLSASVTTSNENLSQKEEEEEEEEEESAPSPKASSSVVRSIDTKAEEPARSVLRTITFEQPQNTESRNIQPETSLKHQPRYFEEINEPAHKALRALKQVVQQTEAECTLTRSMQSKHAGEYKITQANEQIDDRRFFTGPPKGRRLVDKILDSIEEKITGKDIVPLSDLTNPKARRMLAELIERLQADAFSPDEFKDSAAVLREVTTCRKCGLKHSAAESCKDTIRRAAEMNTVISPVLSSQMKPSLSRPFN